MTYEEFRSGYTFKAVRRELAMEQQSARQKDEYKFVTRRTVLGRLRQYKLEAWEYYQKHLESSEDVQ